MRDVQKDKDSRNVTIDRVGVRGVSYPITVMDRDRGTQSTVASVAMSVLLPHEYRGTHMSRFIETLEECRSTIGPAALELMAERLCVKLDATEAEIKFGFPYFMRCSAPASGIASYMRYEASFHGICRDKTFDMISGVEVPVQTLCPCSKEISSGGAHNQRTKINLKVRMNHLVWFEELIDMAERSASTPLYTLLKREDEKYVTERAYANPRFVEDVVRDLAVELNGNDRISWYDISVVSAESIHNHDAFAELCRDKRPQAVPNNKDALPETQLSEAQLSEASLSETSLSANEADAAEPKQELPVVSFKNALFSAALPVVGLNPDSER